MNEADQIVRRLLERWDVDDIRVIKLGKLAPAAIAIEAAKFEDPVRGKAPKPKPPPSPFFAEVRSIKHAVDEQAYVALRERGALETPPPAEST